MSKVMEVLTQMGSDASLQSEEAIEQLLATTEVDAEQAEAIISKDISSLERQLDVRLDLVCGVLPAEDDDEKEDDKENEDDSSSEATNNVVGF